LRESPLQLELLQFSDDHVVDDHVVDGLTLEKARELLDWLEANGITHMEVDLDESELITVHWTE
jgi:hypothetical protein